MDAQQCCLKTSFDFCRSEPAIISTLQIKSTNEMEENWMQVFSFSLTITIVSNCSCNSMANYKFSPNSMQNSYA